METQKTLNSQSSLEKEEKERRMELEESNFLTSDYTTKLQSSRQYGTGTKIEIQTNEIRQNKIEISPEINLNTYWHLIFDKGGKNIQ